MPIRWASVRLGKMDTTGQMAKILLAWRSIEAIMRIVLLSAEQATAHS